MLATASSQLGLLDAAGLMGPLPDGSFFALLALHGDRVVRDEDFVGCYAERMGRPPLGGHVMNNVFFDTCVYHRPGIELLTSVIDPGNILFASEMLGAVRGNNPAGDFPWDDTRRYVDKLHLPPAARNQVYELNARRVYPRLDRALP